MRTKVRSAVVHIGVMIGDGFVTAKVRPGRPVPRAQDPRLLPTTRLPRAKAVLPKPPIKASFTAPPLTKRAPPQAPPKSKAKAISEFVFEARQRAEERRYTAAGSLVGLLETAMQVHEREAMERANIAGFEARMWEDLNAFALIVGHDQDE